MNKKILIINPYIPEYRLPIFNALGQKYDLTILHSGKKIEINCNFKQIIKKQKVFGPFSLTKVNLHAICKQYDLVISEGNIRCLDRIFLVLNKYRKYKWIYWGIGVSASYDKKFDQDKKFDFLRNFIFKHADSNVFYSSYPVDKYISAGFNKSSLFVANNTTVVSFEENILYEKNSILFVGTLYRQKKIYELLDAYKLAFGKSDSVLPLYIIGDGDEYKNVNKWIIKHHLENKIKLIGALFDHEQLEIYFRKALACISPGQAGLSVLTSMGYGTPFVAKQDAITGGEIFNIKNQINGVLYKEDNDLVDILVNIFENNKKYIEMGLNARKYYLEHRKPEQMVAGLVAAIEYALNS